MRLKKINAALGLLSAALLLLHIGYNVFSYLTLYYNPSLSKLTALPFLVVVCLHAVCGMLAVFLSADGSRHDLYPAQNRLNILKRVSAAFIFPLLILHINTFGLMRASAESGNVALIVSLILCEILFFADVITHMATSFSAGLVTLGLLGSKETKDRIDRVVHVLGALAFVAAAFAVVSGQVKMFLLG